MIPTWILTTLVVVAACIVACLIGSSLPNYDYLQEYILPIAIACTVAAVTNNYPALLAFGVWMPFELPISGFRSFPPIALVMGWVALTLFFRLCLLGTIRYVRSFNLLFLLCFAWVPIRFLMNPVYKLGAGVEGGSGVSGATPYFMYAIAAALLVLMGGILNSRERLVSFLRWSYGLVLVIGITFFICAFIPATAPYLYSLGVFAAGNMGDGILRLVQLPAYGFFLIQAALCPDLFRLKKIHSLLLLVAGSAMLVVGGNRSTIIAALFAIPVILVVRRSTHVLLVAAAFSVIAIGMLRFSVSEMNTAEVNPLVRSLSIFDSRIDKASGADASSEWRYAIWQSGWEKIMESPLIGKGFGNLPKHLDPTSNDVVQSTDFEVILAGGEAHNGFITAAYGFGLPFMIALTVGIILRMCSQCKGGIDGGPARSRTPRSLRVSDQYVSRVHYLHLRCVRHERHRILGLYRHGIHSGQSPQKLRGHRILVARSADDSCSGATLPDRTAIPGPWRPEINSPSNGNNFPNNHGSVRSVILRRLQSP